MKYEVVTVLPSPITVFWELNEIFHVKLFLQCLVHIILFLNIIRVNQLRPRIGFSDVIQLRILRWGNYPGFPSEPSDMTNALVRGRQENQSQGM